jgi:hypothetical protein
MVAVTSAIIRLACCVFSQPGSPTGPRSP